MRRFRAGAGEDDEKGKRYRGAGDVVPVTPPAIRRYGVAIVASLLAALLTLLLSTFLHPEAPFMIWFPVIMVSAWYGGLGPGLLATSIAALVGLYALPPPWSFDVDLEDITWLVLFVLATLLICLLTVGLTAARRRSEAAQERYRDLVHELDAIIWEADKSTLRFSFVSQAAEEKLGYPVERWLGDPDFWQSLIHPKDRQGVMEACRFPEPGGAVHEIEHRAVARDGDLKWFRTTLQQVRNGSGYHLRRLMVDITARKRSDEALVREIQASQHANPAAWHRRLHVIRTGQPEIVADLGDSNLVSSGADAQTLELLGKLHPRSVMVVPLSARGRTIGT